jgi:chemotaxis protein methyltransferase CheR
VIFLLLAKDPENFEKLKECLKKNLKVTDVAKYSDNFITRRVEVRLRNTSIDKYSEYIRLLEKDSKEIGLLDEEFSINVTNFFRDHSMWEFFYNTVLPEVVKRKKLSGQKRINIWSAGCSTGEEPLSVCIMLKEFLGDSLGGFEISYKATDFDTDAVNRARRGVYEDLQFREMKQEYKEKYFSKNSDGTYEASSEIKNMISFVVADLFSMSMPHDIDILFCRNTVIYFNLESKSMLYEKFYDCISKGGFFIMGKTELLQGPAREKFKIYDSKERVYQKE